MGAVKPSGQDVRAGEAFVECTEKPRFPGFRVSGRAATPPGRSETASRRKEHKQQHQKMAAERILNTTLESKMGIPAETRRPLEVTGRTGRVGGNAYHASRGYILLWNGARTV